MNEIEIVYLLIDVTLSGRLYLRDKRLENT